MKLYYPRYEKGEKWWNPEEPDYEIDTDDYIKEFTCFQDSLIIITSKETLEELTNLLDDVNDTEDEKILNYFTEQKKIMNDRHRLLIKEMPKNKKDEYTEKYKSSLSIEFNRLAKLNNQFVMDNKEEFLKVLNEYIYKEANKLKLARSEANKKYYLKKKEMLLKVPKKVLTDDEKRERQKQYSKKYYDTHKKIEKPEKTEEQLKKAEIKRKYYLSNKELKKQLLELSKKEN